MQLEEFSDRTGFYPSLEIYGFIENAYLESGLDKDDFCTAYKLNEKCIAEIIAHRATLAKIDADDMAKKTIADLEQKIISLSARLEKEQEWKPYESDRNVKQSDYESLATSDSTRILSDDEAKDIVAYEFGFDRSKIIILHSVDKEEISRRRSVRTVGEIERLPLYNATDWNYIRFDCACWHYEMYNGQLSQFYC